MSENNHIKLEAIEAIKTVRDFMPRAELAAIATNMRGEEKQFFFNKIVELAERIKPMPVTYEQDGKGQQAIAYLHYFMGNMNWYITEKDIGTEEETGQRQAFGFADLGMGFPELGYISITELVDAGVDLDLYFEPKMLREI